jgi:hypothetical protein
MILNLSPLINKRLRASVVQTFDALAFGPTNDASLKALKVMKKNSS